MKKNNLFVNGKKVALLALLAASLNANNAKAYDERAYMSSSEQDAYQSYGVLPKDIDTKQNGASPLFWIVASVVGACGLGYVIRDFDKNKQK